MRRTMASALLLAVVLSSSTRATEGAMTEVVRLESVYSFSDTIEKLRSSLEGRGFTVFAVIDQREAARSVRLDMPPTTLIVYGNPIGGTPLMIAAPDFAIELPLKVLVREDAESKVFVVYSPASLLEGRHGLPPGLAARLGGAEPLIAAAVGMRSD
jgi:uncharacterized protein (DUF302 family)